MPPRVQVNWAWVRMKILQGGKAMISIGVDVHKRQCTVAMQVEDGRVRFFEPMANTREGWGELLDQLPPEAGIDSLRKQKYDRLDAERLARKLSVAKQDPLPEA